MASRGDSIRSVFFDSRANKLALGKWRFHGLASFFPRAKGAYSLLARKGSFFFFSLGGGQFLRPTFFLYQEIVIAIEWRMGGA